jgi:TolB-like protein
VTVIERSQIDTVIEESRFQLSGVTTTEESIEVGNILNAEITILGSVSRFGERIELDVRVIRLETGEVLFTQYGSAAQADIREMVNSLGEEISVAIAQLPPPREGSPEGLEDEE